MASSGTSGGSPSRGGMPARKQRAFRPQPEARRVDQQRAAGQGGRRLEHEDVALAAPAPAARRRAPPPAARVQAPAASTHRVAAWRAPPRRSRPSPRRPCARTAPPRRAGSARRARWPRAASAWCSAGPSNQPSPRAPQLPSAMPSSASHGQRARSVVAVEQADVGARAALHGVESRAAPARRRRWPGTGSRPRRSPGARVDSGCISSRLACDSAMFSGVENCWRIELADNALDARAVGRIALQHRRGHAVVARQEVCCRATDHPAADDHNRSSHDAASLFSRRGARRAAVGRARRRAGRGLHRRPHRGAAAPRARGAG